MEGYRSGIRGERSGINDKNAAIMYQSASQSLVVRNQWLNSKSRGHKLGVKVERSEVNDKSHNS